MNQISSFALKSFSAQHRTALFFACLLLAHCTNAFCQSSATFCQACSTSTEEVLIPDSGNFELSAPDGFQYYQWENGVLGADILLNSEGPISAYALSGNGIGQNAAQLINDAPQSGYQSSWSNGFSTNGELLRESPSNEWTFAAWVKLDSGDASHSIIGKELWWGNGYRISVNSNELTSFFMDENQSGLESVTAGEVPSETWTHLAVTHDGTSRKHFINGDLVQEWEDPSSFEFGTGVVGIGWSASGFETTFNGQLDDLGVWHAALSEEEIQAWMNCSISDDQQALVAFWDFESNEVGGYFSDKSGNGNHLDPVNSPVVVTTPLRGDCAVEACLLAQYMVNFEIPGCTDPWACNFDPLANVSLDICDFNCCPGQGCCQDSDSSFQEILIPDSGNFELSAPDGFQYYQWENGVLGADILLNSEGPISAYALSGNGIGQNAAQLINDAPQSGYQSSWSNGFSTNGELLRESPSNEWTFAAWVKLDSGDASHSIIGKELWWGNGYRISVNSNELTSFFMDENQSGLESVTAGEVPSETWTHLAVTHDGTSRKHFINGDLVQEWEDPSSFEFGTGVVGIGWSASGFETTFNGQLDDLGVWHAALSEEEIQAWMNCSISDDQQALVAFWDFESNEVGGYFSDKSGNGNHLDPVNSPVVVTTPLRGDCAVEACLLAQYMVNFEIPGCTDPWACNFDPLANVSLDICDFNCCPGQGCCHDGTSWDYELQQCVAINSADLNNDGCVGIDDLLEFLSAFGSCGESL